MNVISIYPKQLHVVFEMTETEVEMLLDFLNASTAMLDLNNKNEAECSEFVTNEFFPMLNKLSGDLKEMRDGS